MSLENWLTKGAAGSQRRIIGTSSGESNSALLSWEDALDRVLVVSPHFDDAALRLAYWDPTSSRYRQPDEIRWVKSLARVFLLSKQEQPLVPVLERLAELDADDVAVRKKLADLAVKRKDYATASTWSRRARMW